MRLSRPATESFVVLDCDAPDMSKIVIRHSDRLQVVDSYVHVQTCLDVVLGQPLLLEIFCSPSH